MKTNLLYRLPLLLAIAAGFALWASAGSPNWDQRARHRKAELYFLEAQNYYGREIGDAYVSLIERAYELDSADLDIAMDYSMLALSVYDLDSAAFERAYQAVKRRYVTNPSDYDIGVYFANIAARRDRTDDMIMVWTTLDSIYPNLSQPTERLANTYLASYLLGDSTAFDKAVELYQRMQQASGVNFESSSRLVLAYALKSDTVAARNAIEAFALTAPSDPHTAYYAGLQYQYINDYDAALQQFDLACSLDSTMGEAYLSRAELYKQMGDSVGYDREVFHALLSPTLEVEPKIEILHDYVSTLSADSTQRPRITSLFEQLQQMHVGVSELHDLYAYYLYSLDDQARAAEQLSYSVALNPGNEHIWEALLQTYSELDDTTALIEYGLQAMDAFPKNVFFPMTVALTYYSLGENQAALAVADSIDVDNAPTISGAAQIRSLVGDLWAATGDTIQALNAYDQAIGLDPTCVGALNNAAYFMAVRGMDLDKAQKYITTVIALEPNSPTYMDTRAWVAFKRKEYSDARRYIDLALDMYANGNNEDDNAEDDDAEDGDGQSDSLPSDVLEHAGDIYFMDGEPEKALEFWRQALKLDPDNECLSRKVKHKTYFYQ